MTTSAGSRMVIGLTGGIGTGKSNVLAVCQSLGALTIDADQVSREVTARSGPAYRDIVAAFSPAILSEDGSIDRRKLGEIVFTDPNALRRLELIIHPLVDDEVRRRIQASSARVVMIEAIKLLEAGLDRSFCDQVWVTTCSRAQQHARLVSGRKLSREEVQRRASAQMTPAAMIARADRVIDTSGTLSETGLMLLNAWRDLDAGFPAPALRTGSPDDAEGIAAVLNSIVSESGLTAIDRTYSVAQERRYLNQLPARMLLTVGFLGRTLAGFQVVEPYALYTGAMDHVATIGTFIAAPARGLGMGSALYRATRELALEAGYRKLVAMVRSDNPRAQQFYESVACRRCGTLTEQVKAGNAYVDEWIYECNLEVQKAGGAP